MRIGIDISSIPFGTGVSRYTTNLVRALIPQLGNDQLVLFGSSLRQHQTLTDFCRMTDQRINQSLYSYPPKLTSFFFNTFHPPISMFTGPLDVFHTWDWQVPSIPSGKLISTVHDLALFKFPETAHPDIKRHHEVTLKYLKAQNASIIAVSQTTKDDLIDLFAFDPQRISVIPEALPLESCLPVSTEEIAAVKAMYGIKKPYFLIVGTMEKRKNLQVQITAWMHYRQQFDLVIVGKPGGDAIKPVDGLITPGFLDGPDLAALYAGTTVLLYVSLYEGFGLPILEAFYHHVPVVTANNSNLPVVAGNAATYADPARPETIVVAIAQAINQRNQLIQLGESRLKQFSWDTVARQTLALYHMAYDTEIQ